MAAEPRAYFGRPMRDEAGILLDSTVVLSYPPFGRFKRDIPEHRI